VLKAADGRPVDAAAALQVKHADPYSCRSSRGRAPTVSASSRCSSWSGRPEILPPDCWRIIICGPYLGCATACDRSRERSLAFRVPADLGGRLVGQLRVRPIECSATCVHHATRGNAALMVAQCAHARASPLVAPLWCPCFSPVVLSLISAARKARASVRTPRVVHHCVNQCAGRFFSPVVVADNHRPGLPRG
jgi:hypothetical protein